VRDGWSILGARFSRDSSSNSLGSRSAIWRRLYRQKLSGGRVLLRGGEGGESCLSGFKKRGTAGRPWGGGEALGRGWKVDNSHGRMGSSSCALGLHRLRSRGVGLLLDRGRMKGPNLYPLSLSNSTPAGTPYAIGFAPVLSLAELALRPAGNPEKNI
jgi:hypothetical protein